MFTSQSSSMFVAVFFGFPLILAAIAFLFLIEGRYDIGDLASTAAPLDTTQLNSAFDGKLVSLTGTLVTEERVADGLYLKPGNYLYVHRVVEMYAWKEYSGKSYTYQMDWLENPTPTADFKYPDGHLNPPKALASADFRAKAGTLGAYAIDLADQEIPGSTPLSLTADDVELPAEATLADSKTIYVGANSLSSPQVGDLRIHYEEVPSGVAVTAFGTPRGTQLMPYVDGAGHTLYGIYAGTADDAVRQMHFSYAAMGWAIRIFFLLVIWLGTYFIFRAIKTMFGWIPMVGTAPGSGVIVASFFAALGLTAAAVIVSLALHDLISTVFGAATYR